MNEKLLEYFKSDDIHLIQCEHKWYDAYGYEKSQMKKDLLDYITNLQQKYEISQKDIQSLKNNYNDLVKISENKITNLQQENEKLKYNARSQVNDYFKDKYADEVLKKADLIKDFELTCYKNYELKQENERLKEDNLLIKSANKLLSDNLHNYKSRCEKAVEHLKESLDILKGDSDIPIATGNVRNRYLKPVLNILNGSDEECTKH